jgi:co-chaperonin GroES (HSP10)
MSNIRIDKTANPDPGNNHRSSDLDAISDNPRGVGAADAFVPSATSLEAARQRAAEAPAPAPSGTHRLAPLGRRILVAVRALREEQVTEAGIVIPEVRADGTLGEVKANRKGGNKVFAPNPRTEVAAGVVMEIGEHVSSLKVGDIVFFAIYESFRLKLDVDAAIVEYKDVLGIMVKRVKREPPEPKRVCPGFDVCEEIPDPGDGLPCFTNCVPTRKADSDA